MKFEKSLLAQRTKQIKKSSDISMQGEGINTNSGTAVVDVVADQTVNSFQWKDE